MIRNNYRSIIVKGLVCCGIVTAFTSCKFEEDDYFPESASLRVEHAIDKVQSILATPENGWVMQYFCGTGVAQFEGFNLYAKFDKNGKVTMAGNHRYLRDGNAGKYTEATSLYSLLLEDGPVLAFNTWNDVLTPFVDPVSYAAAPNSLVKDGEGMEGDHNFVIMSYNDDEVILRGERHGAEVRLTKCPTSWADYIADTDKLKNYITNTSISSYYVIADTDTLYFTGLRNGRFRYCENLTNPVKLDSLACVFTPKGFRTEKVDSIGSHAFHEFTMAADSTSLVSTDGDVKVIATWDNYIVSHSALWKFDTSLFNVEQQEIYNQIAAELLKINKYYELESISWGKSSGGGAVNGIVLRFYTNSRKSSTNTAGLAVTVSKTSFGKLKFVSSDNDKMDNNLTALCKNSSELSKLMRRFASMLQGTYEVTPDNYFQPKGGRFDAVNGGTSFVLK
jgi:hypothetical protein